MYEGMCLIAFYKLHGILAVSSAAEKVFCSLDDQCAGFFTSECTTFLQALEAPADFTILVLSTK